MNDDKEETTDSVDHQDDNEDNGSPAPLLNELVVFKSTDESNPVIRLLSKEFKTVVKLFDSDQNELWSCKFWDGDIQRVIDHWTMTPAERPPTAREKELFLFACTSTRDTLVKLTRLVETQEKTGNPDDE